MGQFVCFSDSGSYVGGSLALLVWSLKGWSKVRDQTKSDPLVLRVRGFGAGGTTLSRKKQSYALVFALMWFVTQGYTPREVLCLSRAACHKVLRDAWCSSRRVLRELFAFRKALKDD